MFKHVPDTEMCVIQNCKLKLETYECSFYNGNNSNNTTDKAT